MNEPKRLPQVQQEMIKDMGDAKKEKRKLYKVESDEHKAAMLSALVSRSTIQLFEADNRGKIHLFDTETVKAQTLLYLQCCAETGSFPSIVGLSRSLGYSRRAIYDEMEKRTNPETADWLEMCRDTFSEILAESALTNNANTIMAVFLSKAVYGLRESFELFTRPINNPLGELRDPEEIMKRYKQDIPFIDFSETD